MNDESRGTTVALGGASSSSEGIGTRCTPPAQPVARSEPAPLTHGERRLIVISMMLPVFLGSIDQSILASALPTIGRVFGNVHDLPWLITSYLIAATAMTPLYG